MRTSHSGGTGRSGGDEEVLVPRPAARHGPGVERRRDLCRGPSGESTVGSVAGCRRRCRGFVVLDLRPRRREGRRTERRRPRRRPERARRPIATPVQPPCHRGGTRCLALQGRPRGRRTRRDAHVCRVVPRRPLGHRPSTDCRRADRATAKPDDDPRASHVPGYQSCASRSRDLAHPRRPSRPTDPGLQAVRLPRLRARRRRRLARPRWGVRTIPRCFALQGRSLPRRRL
mmetsp:Transcript_7425/g.19327  ORF Transcript_7425/g.19327 Transcript_7425/m.19327 type:complete len:230 (+) Transcript_7425:57-746(+)